MDKLRIDKWLWAARFYKTRTLASEEVARGRVEVNGQEVKPAREVKVGDSVLLRQGPVTRTVLVKGLSGTRGPAPVAQQLYEETPDSIRAREQAAERRRLAPGAVASLETGPRARFEPAHRLYASFGFTPCGPFADYSDDPHSVFMTLRLQAPT